jgi:hypothetical protein
MLVPAALPRPMRSVGALRATKALRKLAWLVLASALFGGKKVVTRV